MSDRTTPLHAGARQSKVARISDRVLPAPRLGSLPPAAPLRKMIGPSIILAGLSIGSGEFILWPRLTADYGFVLFWACWLGVTIQFFLNMEIERFSLATGESAVVGFIRLSRVWGPVFLLCATVPWIWPGWATGAASLLSWQVDVPVTATAIVSLVMCGAVLSIGPVVYRTVETIQFVLVGLIFLLLVVLFVSVVRFESVVNLAVGALQFGTVPEGIHLPMLLGALAFAGAGGSVNLAQSNYIKDKGYGMGSFVGRITSPFTGREEAVSDVGMVFEGSDADIERWKVWWRRSNIEHFFSFYLLCILTLAAFCLLAAELTPTGVEIGSGIDFIRTEADEIARRFGSASRVAFLGIGVAVLISTELALLDAVARVTADILKTSFLRDRPTTLSSLYFLVVWVLIGFGIVVLLFGFDQPFVLLVLSAALNGFVMFLYSGLLLWLNWTSFRGVLRPHWFRVLALLGAFAFFGYFSVLTVLDRLGLLS